MRLSHSLLLPLQLLLLHAACCSALFDPVAPQNHRPVSHDAECVPAWLPSDDFCAPVVTYPVSSRLLHERGREGIVARGDGPALETILWEQPLDSILSVRARAEFDRWQAFHDEAAAAAAILPGGARYEAFVAGADTETLAAIPIPGQAECDEVLRRYVCQNQYPRCVDDAYYRHAETGRPLEVHACYSLCHDVRRLCHLSHRLRCDSHHARLDPQHVPPNSYALRFDSAYADGADPNSHFWHVDCIDSPPSAPKHAWKWLLYGGPASYALYTLAALLLFSFASWALGLRGETATRALLRIRRDRRIRRSLYAARMRRAQKRYLKLQELTTRLQEAQMADQESLEQAEQAGQGDNLEAAFQSPSLHALRQSMSDRSVKLSQLAALLTQLEASIVADDSAERASRMREVQEDVNAGRVHLHRLDRGVVRAYVRSDGPELSITAFITANGGGGEDSTGRDESERDGSSFGFSAADALAEAEALAAEEEEEARLLGRDDALLFGDAGLEDGEEEEEATATATPTAGEEETGLMSPDKEGSSGGSYTAAVEGAGRRRTAGVREAQEPLETPRMRIRT